MIAWFARNHVAANLLMFCIILAGLYSLTTQITLEKFPSLEPDTIRVTVALRGSTPEDSELAVATRIEEAIKDLEGIKEYSSRSTEGSAQITLEVENGYDPREILDDVKSRIDALNTLPTTAERPVISLAIWKQHVITATLAGDISEKEIRELAEQVREDILKIPDVTQVAIEGIRDYEISIHISQDNLRRYNLSLDQVAQAIRESSLDLSAGNVKSEGGDILLRSKGQAYRLDDFQDIALISGTDGTLISLGEIAEVRDGFEESAVKTRFNGQLAATISVRRVGQQSAIKIAEDVKAYIEDKQASLPRGVSLAHWDDDSVAVKNRIQTLTNNAVQGGILVLLLLSLFLRPAVALWVFIGIPVCFLGAFFMLPIMGVSLNLVSLFGFIVVLGIVVDDAIVTGENVYSHMEHAENGLQAAIKGTQEIAMPVTFGVLTTIVAFVPPMFMEGHRGPIFAQIPIVVIPVLIFSLIESKFVLPSHLKHIDIHKPSAFPKLHAFQQRFAKGFETSILKYYNPLLKRAIEYRWTTLAAISGVFLIVITTIMTGHTRFMFFPRIPSESVRVNLTMPAGTPFEATDLQIERINNAALALQRKYIDEATGESIITSILSSTGGRGGATHQGRVKFEITPPESRKSDIDSRQLSREWRKAIGDIPGAEEVTFRAEIGRTSDPIDIQVRANNFDILESISEQVRDHLATYPTVFDINDSLADGKEELQLELKPEAKLQGISRADLIRQVRQAFFGLEAQRIQRGRDDIRVMIRFPREERNSIYHLNSMLITSPSGQKIPLAHLATFKKGQSAATIYRINGYRTVNIRADIEKENTNMVVLQRELKAFMEGLIAQYPGVNYKLGGESEEQSESVNSLAWGTLGAFFAIYCLLAIPFRSYGQPLIVISVIPFGLIGGVLGHWFMGIDLTIMSAMGLLALTGVVVNDSLVLVDYINKARLKGASVTEAILAAGSARFRPVILTSLTTFIGLMPLLFEKATQAQFLIPMAVSLSFGIIFATCVTLVLVPVNYLLMYNGKQYLRSLWHGPQNLKIEET